MRVCTSGDCKSWDDATSNGSIVVNDGNGNGVVWNVNLGAGSKSCDNSDCCSWSGGTRDGSLAVKCCCNGNCSLSNGATKDDSLCGKGCSTGNCSCWSGATTDGSLVDALDTPAEQATAGAPTCSVDVKAISSVIANSF